MRIASAGHAVFAATLIALGILGLLKGDSPRYCSRYLSIYPDARGRAQTVDAAAGLDGLRFFPRAPDILGR